MPIKNIRRLRRGLKASVLVFLALPWFILRAGAQTAQVSTAPVRIEKIVFRGNRTVEKLLRGHLPFSEGDPLGPSALKDARTGLWDMRQFKQVEVSSCAVPGGNAEIDITVADGWYLVPFPFFSGGSGGGRGGLVLFAKNVFKRAESIMASAASGSAGSSYALALRLERLSFGAAVRRREATERQYADGAFSASSGFGSPPDAREPSRYGEISDSYKKTTEETTLSMGFPLTGGPAGGAGLSAAFGWEAARLAYSAPAPVLPADAGRQGQAFISLRSGRAGAGAAEAIGALFGFGLADMERRLAPLPVHSFTSGAEVSYHKGAAWTGSDFNYGYFLAQWESTLTWGTHRSLSLRLAGGNGSGLPPNRLPATGRVTGLSGNYAREFRGNSAAGASLIYSHPFRITRRGLWQGALFAETARAWAGQAAGVKTGAGASFWYKFWRFPLPLGFSYTYSFDDRDSQLSAALGGRF
ncbi:MAG: hypothetical protein WCW52_09485 [Elusimicrobiales bacterium]|jgi:hypothetical protein